MDEKKAASLLGRRIKQLRKEKGLTQDMASEKAGTITERRWSDIERGMYSVRLPTLYKIAKGLGVPVYELFHFEMEKPKTSKDGLLKGKTSKLKKELEKTEKQLLFLKNYIRKLRKTIG